MSSEALSEQSRVRKAAGYEEVYLLGQDDPGASYLERVSSTNSPSEEKDEDEDMDGLESDTNEDSDGEENFESPIRTVIGPNSLRNFVLPFMWMVNKLTQPLIENTSTTYERDIKFPLTSLSVCLLSLKSATTMVLLMSGCMNKCSRQDLDCL